MFYSGRMKPKVEEEDEAADLFAEESDGGAEGNGAGYASYQGGSDTPVTKQPEAPSQPAASGQPIIAMPPPSYDEGTK